MGAARRASTPAPLPVGEGRIIEPGEHLGGRVTKLPGLGLGRRLGNRPDYRLRVAATDQEPGLRPVQSQPVQSVGRRLGKAPPGRRRRGDFFFRQGNLRLHDLVTRQLGRQLANRKPTGRHGVQQNRHADEAVADQAHAGIDWAAVPLAAENRLMFEHGIDDVRLAHRRTHQRHAMPLGDVLRHAAGGAIDHNRAAPLAEHVLNAHRHGILLAQVAARAVDHGQPVGVRVLAEADVGPGLRHGRQHAGQVFGRWLGRVLELPVGLFPEDGHAAA